MATYEFRELGLGEIIDIAFTLLRRHFSALFGIAVITQGVPVILAAYLQFAGPLTTRPGLWLAWLVLTSIGGLLLSAATLHAVSRAYLGGEPEVHESLAHAVSCMLPLFVAGLAKYLLISLTALATFWLFFVPAIIVACGYALVPQVIVLERPVAPTDALGRSWALTKGFKGKVFLLWLTTYLLIYVPQFAFGILAGIAEVAGLPFVAAPIQVLGPLILLPLYPLVGCAFTLLYYDLRLRKEAFDLELLEEQLAASAA